MTVIGRAVFTPTSEGRLRYREDGRMRLPDGAELDASADYLFAPSDGRLDMLFDEAPPRLFQAFALADDGRALVGDGTHDCPPDRYVSHIAFEADGSWSLTHQVTGPRKSYVSETLFRRAPRELTRPG